MSDKVWSHFICSVKPTLWNQQWIYLLYNWRPLNNPSHISTMLIVSDKYHTVAKQGWAWFKPWMGDLKVAVDRSIFQTLKIRCCFRFVYVEIWLPLWHNPVVEMSPSKDSHNNSWLLFSNSMYFPHRFHVAIRWQFTLKQRWFNQFVPSGITVAQTLTVVSSLIWFVIENWFICKGDNPRKGIVVILAGL